MAKIISVAAGMSEITRRGTGSAAAPSATHAAVRIRIRRFIIDSSPAPDEQPQKNGPPMTAVTIPTGSSIGANSVRATRSQAIRNAAPNSADAGSTRR